MLAPNLCHRADHRGYCLYLAAWKLADVTTLQLCCSCVENKIERRSPSL